MRRASSALVVSRSTLSSVVEYRREEGGNLLFVILTSLPLVCIVLVCTSHVDVGDVRDGGENAADSDLLERHRAIIAVHEDFMVSGQCFIGRRECFQLAGLSVISSSTRNEFPCSWSLIDAG